MSNIADSKTNEPETTVPVQPAHAAKNSTRANSHVVSDEVVVRIENLTKSFDELEVLRGVNVNVHRGEVVVILGPSGSGQIDPFALRESARDSYFGQDLLRRHRDHRPRRLTSIRCVPS